MFGFLRQKRRLGQVSAKPSLPALLKLVRVLVIDDDPNSFPIKALQSEGYSIEYWPNVENVGRLENGEFDIIILDIKGVATQWSSQDGLGVLEHLKKRNPAQIIVAFSGETFDLNATRFFKLADETLPKPVDALKCKQVIDGMLETSFTIQHFWAGISKILAADGASDKAIRAVEERIVEAIDRNGKVESAYFHALVKTMDHALVLASLTESILKLSGH